MTQKNLEAYILSIWGAPQKTVSEISASNNAKSLVASEQKMYCFDDICKDIFGAQSLPASADGLVFRPKYIELVEFKSGFKEKISKANFDLEKAKCEIKGAICSDYWTQFNKARKLEKGDLVSSLYMKAVESFITLDQRIFPHCEDMPDKQLRIKYTIVIDAEETDTIDDLMAGLAGKKSSSESMYTKIRKAVSKLCNQTDKYGQSYFYDMIEVVSAEEYQKRLNWV